MSMNANDYFDYLVQGDPKIMIPDDPFVVKNTRTWTSLSRPLSVILLRIGFIFLHIGNVPIGNVNLIFLQNLVDLCCVTLTFFLVGYIIAYNGDRGGIMGQGYWIGHDESDIDEAIIGWQSVAISSAICTTGIVGRTHTIAYAIVAIVLAGLVQPFIIHWAWTPYGWMVENYINKEKVMFQDYAGAATVHLVGGISALIGCLSLGKRMLRLKDIDDASINITSGASVFAGQLMILIGLLGTSLPTFEPLKLRMEQRYASETILNYLLAASSCALLVVTLHFAFSREHFNHWSVNRCIHAMIAGAILVSAGVDSYLPLVTVALACLGGVMFYITSRLIFTSAVEDYCNVIASHLTCGFLGNLLAPLFMRFGRSPKDSMAMNFAWQFICLITIVTYVTVVVGATFFFLKFFGILRNRSEHLNHIRATTILSGTSPRKFVQRIVGPDEQSVYVQSDAHADDERDVIFDVEQHYREHKDHVREHRQYDVIKNKLALVPGAKTKKLRQIHTLPGHDSVLPENNGAGELLDQRDAKESSSKIEDTKELSKINNLILNKTWMSEGDLQREIIIGHVRNIEMISDIKCLDTSADNKASVEEGNYKLRRTLKSMNLHQELEEQETKIKMILKPRYEEVFSSDSQDDNSCPHVVIHSNESIKTDSIVDRSITQDAACKR